jgi:acyl carrier protein
VNQSIEQTVRSALYAIAPDIEGEPLQPEVRYRDQFEFDSMDLLRYVIELHRRTGVDIPEADYPRLETLAGAVAYLQVAGAGAGTGAR